MQKIMAHYAGVCGGFALLQLAQSGAGRKKWRHWPGRANIFHVQ